MYGKSYSIATNPYSRHLTLRRQQGRTSTLAILATIIFIWYIVRRTYLLRRIHELENDLFEGFGTFPESFNTPDTEETHDVCDERCCLHPSRNGQGKLPDGYTPHPEMMCNGTARSGGGCLCTVKGPNKCDKGV